MEYTVQVFSKAFLNTEEDVANWSTATVSRRLWEELLRENINHHRLFLSFQQEQHQQPIICAIGNPFLEHTESHQVYLPYQILDRLESTGSGEEKQISIFTEEAFPEATRITVRFIDSAAYNSDIKEELEEALGKLGILQKDTQYQIPIQALGNFPVDIFVSKLEPADIVFCQGDEVAIEFEEPVDQIIEPQRPPTPIPVDVPFLIIPEGRVLGSDPNHPAPLWRRQIGPPRR